MTLIFKREFKYSKERIIENHPQAECYGVEFVAADGSNIYADFFVPKGECKGVFLEIPDYKMAPKDYLNMSKYAIHNYAVLSLHVRGQVGNSSNLQPWSLYAPFLETEYFTCLYQDALDCLTILTKELPNVAINVYGSGQGAAACVVASAVSKVVANLFVANIDNCDFENIYFDNKDTGYYEPIRDFSRSYFDKEDYMLKELAKIDVLNFAGNVEGKVYYGQSHLNPVTPLVAQNKFVALLKNKEVISYRKFEKENLQEHFFDEFILKTLAKMN